MLSTPVCRQTCCDVMLFNIALVVEKGCRDRYEIYFLFSFIVHCTAGLCMCAGDKDRGFVCVGGANKEVLYVLGGENKEVLYVLGSKKEVFVCVMGGRKSLCMCLGGKQCGFVCVRGQRKWFCLLGGKERGYVCVGGVSKKEAYISPFHFVDVRACWISNQESRYIHACCVL